MGADVYIVPEMASPDLLSISEEYGTIWIGDYKDKGLGVIYNKKLSCKVLPVKFEQKFAIPLRVEDKLVVAFWPTKIGDTKNMSYPKIAQLILEQLEEYFVKMPTLIVGDYNCYKGQSGETKTYSLEAIDNYLQLHGLYSLYHKKSGGVHRRRKYLYVPPSLQRRQGDGVLHRLCLYEYGGERLPHRFMGVSDQ